LATEKQLADAIYQHGYHVIDNFLDYQHYQALRTIIRSMHEKGYFRDAKIGHQKSAIYDSRIRKDQIYWLEETADERAIRPYFAAIHTIFTALNRSLFLGLVDYEAHFAVYEPGTFYKKHIDQFATTQDRRVSCVYYLNDQWREQDGGELVLYDKTDLPLVTIQPCANRFVCFNSELPHEVRTTQKTRYSIAGWFKTRALHFNHPPDFMQFTEQALSEPG